MLNFIALFYPPGALSYQAKFLQYFKASSFSFRVTRPNFYLVSYTNFHSTFGVSSIKHPHALSLEAPRALRRIPFTHKPTSFLIILLKLTTWMPTKSSSVTEHGLESPAAECQMRHCKYSIDSPNYSGSRSSLALKETWNPTGADLGGCWPSHRLCCLSCIVQTPSLNLVLRLLCSATFPLPSLCIHILLLPYSYMSNFLKGLFLKDYH